MTFSAQDALDQAPNADDYKRLNREPRQFQRVEHQPKHIAVGHDIITYAKRKASNNRTSLRLCLIEGVTAQSGISARAKMAYISISNALREDKGDAWIDHALIGSNMCRSDRTAKRAVRELEELGLILVIKRRFENAYKIVGLDGVEAARTVFRSLLIDGQSDKTDTLVTADHGGQSDKTDTDEVTKLSGQSDTDATFLLPVPSATALATTPLPSPLGETVISGETTDRSFASRGERASPEPDKDDDQSPTSNVVPLRRASVRSETNRVASLPNAAGRQRPTFGYRARQATATRPVPREVEQRLSLPVEMHEEARDIAVEFGLDPEVMIRTYRSHSGNPATLRDFRLSCDVRANPPF